MKVVLLHDWLTGFRGGERVLEVFTEMFPDAPIYTLIHDKGSLPESIERKKIVTSFLQKIPGVFKGYRKFLPLFPTAVNLMTIVDEADLVLSSSHCVIKGLKKNKKSVHISYIHSPMRYLYDQYDQYFGPQAPFYQRFGMRLFRNYLIDWDLKSNKNVDVMIANSGFVHDRIKKYYGRNSFVIHPFVDLKDFTQIQKNPPRKEDFYLMVSAFAPNKKVDLAVEAFSQSGKELRIIGGGQLEAELKKKATANIKFLGSLSRQDVIDHFFRAKGFIFPGVEDFGITPLESLASGTPVVAFKAGGVLETLSDDVAHFFHSSHPESLIKAVEEFEQRSFDVNALYARASQFSKERFKEKISHVIKEYVR